LKAFTFVYNFVVIYFSGLCGCGLQGSPPTEIFALKGQITSAQGNALGHKSAPTPHTRPVRAGQFYVVVFKLPFQGAGGGVAHFCPGRCHWAEL